MRRPGHTALRRRTRGAIGFLVALVATTSFAGSALAQSDLGIVLGASSSSLSGDSPPNGTYTSLWSPIVGLSGELEIGDGLLLIMQPQYLTRGTVVAYAVEGQEEPVDSLTLSLSYVSIPMGLKVVSPSGRYYASSVFDLGILTGATLDNGSTEEDARDGVDDIDPAIGLGVGGRFSMGRRPVTIELRYSQSLSNLPSGRSNINGFPVRYRTSGLQLVAGLFLGLGGS